MTNDRDWPTSPEFRRFATLIADGVTWAINSGFKVAVESLDPDCMCPEGAVLCARWGGWQVPTYPTFDEFSERTGCDPGGAHSFAVGFDGKGPRLWRIPRSDPYYRLGCAYRERFVK